MLKRHLQSMRHVFFKYHLHGISPRGAIIWILNILFNLIPHNWANMCGEREQTAGCEWSKESAPYESRSSLLDQSISLAYKIPCLPCGDRELSEDGGGGKPMEIIRWAHDMKAFSYSSNSRCVIHTPNSQHEWQKMLYTLKRKGATKSSSDAIEEPFLVPQRTIQSKVLFLTFL